MKILKFITSKGLKIYILIGLVVYIIPYFFGATNAVRLYLEQKIIFPDYIEKIEQIYINKDKDIAMCVTGNTRGQEDIEYWIYIPYSHYEYSEENFYHSRVTDFSGIKHNLMKIVVCNKMPWTEKGFYQYTLPTKYINELPEHENQLINEIFDVNRVMVYEDTVFIIQNSNRSQLALVRFVGDNKKIGTLFRMSNIHYPEKLNPLWKLLYIPAFILDVLLWPLYLVLLLYSPLRSM